MRGSDISVTSSRSCNLGVLSFLMARILAATFSIEYVSATMVATNLHSAVWRGVAQRVGGAGPERVAGNTPRRSSLMNLQRQMPQLKGQPPALAWPFLVIEPATSGVPSLVGLVVLQIIVIEQPLQQGSRS
jgi:hypothetical protein